MIEPGAAQIAAVFNREFECSHRTVMIGGGEEPLYVPATPKRPARVVYTRDYPASALHEASHWCLAGAQRRERRDYGYWYLPGPRSAAQRRAFFAAEADVQALEAVFATASGVKFVVSADDFAAPPAELEAFAALVEQRMAFRAAGRLPVRAQRFHAALQAAFGGGCG
jgi:elongation factor P hydroxylase